MFRVINKKGLLLAFGKGRLNEKISSGHGRQSNDHNGGSFACIVHFWIKTSQEEKAADVEPAQAVQEDCGRPSGFIDFTADWASLQRDGTVLKELRGIRW